MENEQQNPKSTESYLLEMVRKDSNLQVAFFLSIWILCMLIAALIVQGIEAGIGYRFKELFEALKNGEIVEGLNAFKLAQMCSHLLQYFIPSMLFVVILYPKRIKSYLFVDKLPYAKNMIIALVLIITIFPFISWVYYWNTNLLPTESISKETLEIQRLLLKMETPMDLFLNILLFGIIAGVGEELLFRGIIQRVITKMSQNIHIGAIITGFLFSAMHFQLEGFIPRMILGVLFGYMLILTGSLWITMLVHVFFNSFQVLIPYFYPQSGQNISEVQQVSTFLGLASLLVFVIIMLIFIKNNKVNQNIYINNIKSF